MTITNEDNMKLMARYEDDHFDLAIVDPPYGINASNMTMGSGKHQFKKGKDWDKGIPTKGYFNELFRVSKNQIIWGGNYFTEFLHPTPHWLVWDKNNPNLSFAEGELAWVRNGKNLRIFKKYSAIADTVGGKIHPPQKHVILYEWILDNYATCKTCNNKGFVSVDNLGDKLNETIPCMDCVNHDHKFRILDTHLGSGSIAIACHNRGFDLTACELDKEYFDAAMKRLEQHQAQIRMF